MLPTVVILSRLAQYGGAAVLFGSSLFFLYGLPARGGGAAAALPWPKPLLSWAAAVLGAATIVGLLAQTAVLAGSVAAGLQPGALGAVVTSMALGPSALIRAAAALAALVAVIGVAPGRTLWASVAGLGAVACASFAWMGHGAANDGAAGWVHLVADITHALAASVWIGALAVFAMLLSRSEAAPEHTRALNAGLQRFSGVGSVLVAVLVVTGAVNGAFTVGVDRLDGLWTTPYGQILVLKLLLFVAMLGLAAANRFRLTPALASALDAGASRARRGSGCGAAWPSRPGSPSPSLAWSPGSERSRPSQRAEPTNGASKVFKAMAGLAGQLIQGRAHAIVRGLREI